MTTSLIPTVGLPLVGREDDIADIRTLLAGVEAGVTTKDPDRCIAQFAADARSVVASGARSIGREAIRAAHVRAFAGSLAGTVARFEILDLLFVKPDVAVATTGAWAQQDGESEVDLEHPSSVVVYVLVRHDTQWWVAARQFTKVVTAV